MTNPATTTPPIEVRLQLQRSGFALDVDMQLPGRGITALFGPSGCGKTTCLRAMAGLEHAPLGWVRVHGEVWQNDGVQDGPRIWRPPHQRALGYVFQDSQLFDHLDVRGNIHYGLRRTPVAQRLVAVEQLVELLGIGALMERKPATLSGGERQRVAIARALATSPRLLLMDEPLASLDAARKAELLPYFERLQRDLDIPMLYVTHSLDEVARLADDVLLLDAGRLLAHGATGALMTRLDLSLTHGDSASARIDGTLQALEPRHGLMSVRFAGGVIDCVQGHADPARLPGQRVRLRVQARDVSLALTHARDTSILNVLPATVQALADDGPAQVLVSLALGGTPLLARITRKSAAALALAPGQRVFAQIKGVAVLD